MKILPRCSCTSRDGTQCGRRVRDGSQPPVCHIHQRQQQGTMPALVQPVARTPLEIIQKLMTDRDPSIRLRAANAYLDHLAKQGPDRPHRDGFVKAFLAALTDDEKAELAGLLAALRAFKARVYERDPDLSENDPRVCTARPTTLDAPEDIDYGPERQHDQSPGTRPTVSEPSAVKPAAADVGGDPASVVTTDDAVTLPRDRWDDVGLYEQDGIVTHALGDEHAQNILTGVITFEEARDHHHTASRQDRIMAGSMTPRKGICR